MTIAQKSGFKFHYNIGHTVADENISPLFANFELYYALFKS